MTEESPATMRSRFIDAMSANATSVTVVTTDGVAGRHGVTVSAFSSVSADPPTVLICVKRGNMALAALLKNRRFAVNLLAEHQQDVSDVFAGRSNARFDFSVHRWVEGRHGMPVFPDAASCFECEVISTHDSGSHTVVVGAILAIRKGLSKPLLYCQRRYARLRFD